MTSKELSARILVEAEHAPYLEAIEVVPQSVSSEWLDALYQEQSPYQIQLIDWLKPPSARRSETHLTELFHKIEALKELGVHNYNLPFPLERQRYCASRMRRRFLRRLGAMSLLMPLDEWEKNKGKYYKALGLPRSPEKFLAHLKEQL